MAQVRTARRSKELLRAADSTDPDVRALGLGDVREKWATIDSLFFRDSVHLKNNLK